MAFRLSYFKAAKEDVREAKKWYHNQLPGLEKRFAKDMKNSIERLTANPYTHAIRYNKFRIAHADIFPYSIHFFIEENTKRIVIVGIVHDSRDTTFLKHRV